jgi:hypothetical protein
MQDTNYSMAHAARVRQRGVLRAEGAQDLQGGGHMRGGGLRTSLEELCDGLLAEGFVLRGVACQGGKAAGVAAHQEEGICQVGLDGVEGFFRVFLEDLERGGGPLALPQGREIGRQALAQRHPGP